jgi:hypothetical protein
MDVPRLGMLLRSSFTKLLIEKSSSGGQVVLKPEQIAGTSPQEWDAMTLNLLDLRTEGLLTKSRRRYVVR